MFKLGSDGKGVHFWLHEGVMTPLLLWRSASGVAMELRGRTVTHRASGYQWFKEVEIARDGVTVMRAVAQDPTHNPTYGLIGSEAQHEAGPLEVELDGVPLQLRHLAGEAVAQRRSRRAALTLAVSGHQRKLRVEVSTLEAGQPHKPEAGLLLDLVSARAAKLGDAADAAKYHHLNLHLVSGIPVGATGAFAELAGSQPMSERVRAMLRRPEVRGSGAEVRGSSGAEVRGSSGAEVARQSRRRRDTGADA